MFIDNGKQAVITASADITAGDVVTVKAGKIFGVAHSDIKNGEAGVVDLEGKFTVAKDSSAFTLGDKVYFGADGATSGTTGTSAIGICAADAAAADAAVSVFFDGLAAAKK